ncbi:MAG: hypothetical protein LBV45_11515 [Xanthomonadaceae bacterium]|jgi:hypothetical protein|nr:hypothetical protein [Xanthomonadaceae bacterium]
MSLLIRGSASFLAAVLAFSSFGVYAQEQTGEQSETPSAVTSALLADPKVGDLYAAEVSHFSGVGFNSNSDDGSNVAYGLMKVVNVTRDKVVVITENAAWPRPQGARNDLRGDLSDITWDEEEKITLYRSELPSLYSSGKIIEARRISAGRK